MSDERITLSVELSRLYVRASGLMGPVTLERSLEAYLEKAREIDEAEGYLDDIWEMRGSAQCDVDILEEKAAKLREEIAQLEPMKDFLSKMGKSQ